MKTHIKNIEVELGNGTIIKMTLAEARELMEALQEVVPATNYVTSSDIFGSNTIGPSTLTSITDNKSSDLANLKSSLLNTTTGA